MSEEVEARVIDVEMAEVTKADEWLAQARERAAALASQYTPHEIVDDADYKRSKTDRASVRKDADTIEREGRALVASAEKTIKDFKAGIKEAVDSLRGIDAEYAERIGAHEQAWRDARMAELRGEYEDYAPSLAELVPFEMLVQRYGSERGRAWQNRSTSIVAAKKALCEACDDIADGERDIDALVADEADRNEVKALYFETLDLHRATTRAREMREQRERVAELERQRAEWAAQAAACAARLPETAEAHEECPDYVPAAVAGPEARSWVVIVPSATRPQMQSLAEALKALGLRGRIVGEDTYRREVCGG